MKREQRWPVNRQQVGRKVVVYAGPTISPEEVRAVLPEAVVRPPAARGDLLVGNWRPGDVAVVIDGYFRERRSVGHKEILWLLSEGVDVVGAASMGALRAAELGPCGMRGVGAVYGMYVSGEIDGDDEVGVLHGPAAKGYPAQTVALVNLRYGCREGAQADLVPAAAGQRIVAAAKELPFTVRTWTDLEQRVGDDDRDALRTLRQMIDSGEWDLKRRDAIAALRAVERRDTPATAPKTTGPKTTDPQRTGRKPTSPKTTGPKTTGVPFTGISHNQVLTRRSRREYAPGRWMSDLDVLDAARLFDADYPGWHEGALADILADLAAEQCTTVTAYAQDKLGIDDRSPLPDRLAWWLTEGELALLTPAERIRLVLVRVWPIWQSVDWRPTVLARLRGSDRWPQWTDLVARADEKAEETRYRLVVPQPAICARIFLRHWRQPGSSQEIEMARRGFSSLEELGRTVTRFFALDVQNSRGSL